MDEGPSKISERLKALIECRTDKRGKFAQLEEATGITAESWKSFYYGRQRPNPDMIEAAARTWPESAFWLATGIEDLHHGHIDPTREHDPISERTAAKPYFKKLMEIQQTMYESKTSEGFEKWEAKVKQLEAQLDALLVIRIKQEQALAALDNKENVAF